MSLDNLILDLQEAVHRFENKVRRKPYTEPTLYIDPKIVEIKLALFKEIFTSIPVYYAVKANPSLPILSTLAKDPLVGFDVASKGEIELLKTLSVPPSRIIYSNPVKPISHIQYALDYGVKYFTIDSLSEYLKMCKFNTDMKLLLRIAVPNVGSAWPLDGKFGADEEIDSIIDSAVIVGDTSLAGVMFHVGSQCMTPVSWKSGLDLAIQTIRKMEAQGLRPQLIDIGGGFPVSYQDMPVDSKMLYDIADAIRKAAEPVHGAGIIAEPGRFLVAEAGIVKCQVLATATRKQKDWVHLDAGIFGGLIEPSQKICYDIIDHTRVKNNVHIAGPTCDSVDVVSKDWKLPKVKEGDVLMFRNAGAYTSAYSSNFNGFSPMRVEVVN